MEMIELCSEIEVRVINKMGGDHMIVGAMLASTDPDAGLKITQEEGTEGLAGRIRFLMRHRHGTPFEHSAMTFFVDAPIMVWREWHRHRIGMSYNEESGRYKQLRPKFWVPRATRKMVPAEDHKPSAPHYVPATEELWRIVKGEMADAYSAAWNSYTYLLSKGVAKEVSRAVLPVAVYSRCWVTCNPRSLMHYLSLRTHEPTAKFVSYPQAEIEEAARACEKVLAEGWPLTYAAFCENGRCGP